MSWQDVVYSLGNCIFAIALIPSVRSNDKPHIKTSVSTSLVLFTFVVTSFSLELYLTSFVTFIGACMWAVLAIQKYKQK